MQRHSPPALSLYQFRFANPVEVNHFALIVHPLIRRQKKADLPDHIKHTIVLRDFAAEPLHLLPQFVADL